MTSTLKLQQDELADETDGIFNGAYVDKFAEDRFGVAASVFYDQRTTREDYFRAYNWQVYPNVPATSYQTGEDLGNIYSHEPIGMDLV